MKRTVLALALALVALMAWVTPALAADVSHGSQVFSANCVACHMGGGNVVNGAKTLKKSALDQYEMASVEAITRQVTHGKAAMPAFKGRLTDADIADVAAYVLSQAEQGW